MLESSDSRRRARQRIFAVDAAVVALVQPDQVCGTLGFADVQLGGQRKKNQSRKRHKAFYRIGPVAVADQRIEPIR
jgi:hypothetical protein